MWNLSTYHKHGTPHQCHILIVLSILGALTSISKICCEFCRKSECLYLTTGSSIEPLELFHSNQLCLPALCDSRGDICMSRTNLLLETTDFSHFHSFCFLLILILAYLENCSLYFSIINEYFDPPQCNSIHPAEARMSSALEQFKSSFTSSITRKL